MFQPKFCSEILFYTSNILNEIKNDYSCGLNFGEDFLIEEISFKQQMIFGSGFLPKISN